MMKPYFIGFFGVVVEDLERARRLFPPSPDMSFQGLIRFPERGDFLNISIHGIRFRLAGLRGCDEIV